MGGFPVIMAVLLLGAGGIGSRRAGSAGRTEPSGGDRVDRADAPAAGR